LFIQSTAAQLLKVTTVAKTNNQNSVKIAFGNIVKRIQNTLEQAVEPASLKPLARDAIAIIQRRTLLGYGALPSKVKTQVGDITIGVKYKLPPLSAQYIKFRKKYKQLSGKTSARKSNLTLTGALLESIGILKSVKIRGYGLITIAPIGQHGKGLSNVTLASYLSKQKYPGRHFMELTEAEFNQILRNYRKTFGDLLSKAKLLR
jgi:hypothetical protein